MLAAEEYERQRSRPVGRAAMRQRWRDLLFLHCALEPDEVQRHLPSELTVDTYPDENGREMAWVGLVPFRMEGVTPILLPPVHGCHAFPETNVRTYAHYRGRDPGVWFFSLEAANAFACRYARRFFSLPYHWAAMAVRPDGAAVAYESRRRGGAVATMRARCDLGTNLGHADRDSLEFFLIERYRLYAVHGGRLHSGLVHHRPYPLTSVAAYECEESLLPAAGLRAERWRHAIFSSGVDVEVYALTPVD